MSSRRWSSSSLQQLRSDAFRAYGGKSDANLFLLRPIKLLLRTIGELRVHQRAMVLMCPVVPSLGLMKIIQSVHGRDTAHFTYTVNVYVNVFVNVYVPRKVV